MMMRDSTGPCPTQSTHQPNQLPGHSMAGTIPGHQQTQADNQSDAAGLAPRLETYITYFIMPYFIYALFHHALFHLLYHKYYDTLLISSCLTYDEISKAIHAGDYLVAPLSPIL